MRNHPFRTVVGQGHYASAISHQWCRAAADRDKGIATHIERDTKSFARGLREIILQLFCRRKCHAVYNGMERSIFFFQGGEKGSDLVVARDVAHERLSPWKRLDQVVCFFLQPLILVRDS